MPRIPRFPIMLLVAMLALPTSAGSALARPAPPLRASEAAAPAALAAGQVQLGFVLGGLNAPTAIANAGDGSGRLFIAEQGGTVRVVVNNAIQGGTFLNVTGVAGGFTSGDERGLLGLAFHPSFETNRRFYAYYTDGSGDLVIAEFTATADGSTWNGADPVVLLDIEHSSASNHNGGQLLFGPDGNLYIFTGDGGGAGDPFCNAQSTSSALGKILRLNVPGNGTATNAGGNLSGSIWDLGLRNPWRASFDRATGDLWIGDVGQNAWEEINFKPAGSASGWNWGWSDREGAHPYSGDHCPSSGIAATDPLVEYSQSHPVAVTGGFVYRGTIEQNLIGHYIFTDFYTGNLWTFAGGGTLYHGSTGSMISSFGEDEAGELFAVDLVGGYLFRVVAPPYSDIADSQFYQDILWLNASGITAGCGGGRFCPNDPVTRQQMASFLARAKALGAPIGDYFVDDNGSPHEADINKVREAGIAFGCGAYLFCPETPITREQMASFLARAKGLGAPIGDYFVDDNGSPHEADINSVKEAGYASGCGAFIFCPGQFVTRGQMAAFLHRAFD
jgi:glucose/arabinose dehydrogenase